IASDNGKYLIMNVVRADGREGAQNPIDAIDAHLAAVRGQFPGVEAGMTGGPALARTEATSTARDIALASLIAIVSNVLLVVIPFGGIVEPAFALTALLIGVAWSFGFTALAIGHLNLLSAVFTSILAGIGINFPIHLMARYDEARGAGRITRESIELGVVNTGAGVVASACIMALAFLMPIFSDFKGIAELGIVSAGGLFFCLLSAMLVFPSLLVIPYPPPPPPPPPWLLRSSWWKASPGSSGCSHVHGLRLLRFRRRRLSGWSRCAAFASIRTYSSSKPNRRRPCILRSCCSRIRAAHHGSRSR